MPRGCKPTGDHALSNAERQARYRARQQVAPDTAVTRPRHPTDRRSRPQRWRDAVGTLLTLQAEPAIALLLAEPFDDPLGDLPSS
jgi:hypothetical protein